MGAATSSAWRGRLVMFLALFLVPVVIVATPSVAAAAETVTRGPTASATVDGFSLFSAVPGNDQTCTLTAQWVTPAAESILTPPFVELGGISCSQGNAFDNIGGAEGSNMTVELQGEGCGGSGVFGISYANGFDPSLATFPGGPVAVDAGCSIGEVCLTYETHGGGLASWFSHTYDTTCSAIGLGLPPVRDSAGPVATCAPHPDTHPSETIAPVGLTWRQYMYNGTNPVEVPRLHIADPAPRAFTINFAYYHHPSYPRLGGTFSFAAGATSAEYDGLWGPRPVPARIQLYPSNGGTATYPGHPGFDQTRFDGNPNPGGVTGIWNLNDATASGVGLFGVTLPKACAFYFGVKIYDDGDPSAGWDEPYGPEGSGELPPPPSTGDPVEPPAAPAADPTADACGDGFSFFKPSTWAGATTCAVVAALKAIWEVLQALGGAVANLPGRIADAFGALFVPESGFVADKVDNVKSRWDDTAPVVLVDEVAGLGDTFSMGSPGGCAGPPLNIDTEFTGSLSLNPLSACGPQVSVVANIVKIALTVIVYVGAGLGALRLLGSSLGLDLSIDKSGE